MPRSATDSAHRSGLQETSEAILQAVLGLAPSAFLDEYFEAESRGTPGLLTPPLDRHSPTFSTVRTRIFTKAFSPNPRC